VQPKRGVIGIAYSARQLPFTGPLRDDGLEADSLGVEYAASVGYDPGGLASFVARLGRHAGEGPLAELTATHPRPGERIDRLNRIALRIGAGGATLAERFRQFVPAGKR
jgi:predicted Zn-dependent protease